MDLASTVELLADGQWHPVGDAGQCQALLNAAGLTAETAAGNRCRLSRPIELLDRQRIQAALKKPERTAVDVATAIDSTNTRLLDRPSPAPGTGYALLAEFQTAGRGRHDRTWLCPYAGGLCMSIAWQFEPVPRHPGTLSLAVGVALLRALTRHGVSDIKLKWPNDILHRHRKLGGVLIDVVRIRDTMQIVAGIGLNLVLTARETKEIAQTGGIPAVALSDIDDSLATGRNALAAAVIDDLTDVFVEYARKGFEPFQQEYNHADMLQGREVHVTGPADSLDGQAIGVDESGALLVQSGGAIHRLFSGDVRVRM